MYSFEKRLTINYQKKLFVSNIKEKFIVHELF